jgi:hypothetical protein
MPTTCVVEESTPVMLTTCVDIESSHCKRQESSDGKVLLTECSIESAYDTEIEHDNYELDRERSIQHFVSMMTLQSFGDEYNMSSDEESDLP